MTKGNLVVDPSINALKPTVNEILIGYQRHDFSWRVRNVVRWKCASTRAIQQLEEEFEGDLFRRERPYGKLTD